MIIIGDTAVGKSCLLNRLTRNDFKQEHQITIGLEFGYFQVTLENQIVKAQIWDTAGQESFKSVTRVFYRGAHAVFLTYDITREETFFNAQDWLKEVVENASEDVVVYLVGNKAELESQREVQFEAAVEFAKNHKIAMVFETSAKTGNNVEDVFTCAIKDVYAKKKVDISYKKEMT